MKRDEEAIHIDLDAIEYVGIDLDDTLYDRDFVYIKTFEIMETSVLTTGLTFEDFNQVFQQHSLVEFRKFANHEKGNYDYKTDRVFSTYQALGQEITTDQVLIFHSLYEYFRRNIELRPDVEDFISTVEEAGKKVFILTNGPEMDQQQKLNTLGLDELVAEDVSFISGAIGYSKPDKRVFDHVEDQLGVEGEKILYIGDHVENDLDGSQANGWVPVYFDFAKNTSDSYYAVENFRDLIDLFDKK